MTKIYAVSEILDPVEHHNTHEGLSDGTLATSNQNLQTFRSEAMFDYVVSGCVWTGDSVGVNKNASMTSGVVTVGGKRATVAAVTARVFTASKDTYIDVDNTGTITYTEVTNNAASPALTSGNIRIGIIVTGATTIAAASSINQGQFTAALPTNSSQVLNYGLDTLGNSIFNGNPFARKIAWDTLVASNFTTTSASLVDVTGVSFVYKTGAFPETVYLTLAALVSLNTTADATITLNINAIAQTGGIYTAETVNLRLSQQFVATIPAGTSATIKAQAKTSANTLTVNKSSTDFIPTIRGFGTKGSL